VTLSSAWDITEKVRPPRTVFVDYPLGHTAGKPDQAEEQRRILLEAMDLLEKAEPGQIRKLDVEWDDPTWSEELPKV
jgi:hypothetical protein